MEGAWLAAAGYLVGSLPFASWVARRAGVDIRSVGSRNPGATNVFRTTRPSLALAVVTLDTSKGVLAVWWARAAGAGDGLATAAGVAAVVGHAFPVWLRFRGGKGVATAFGAFSALAPVASGLALASFIATVWLTRYVSLGSLVASMLLPSATYLTDAPEPVVAGAIVASALIVVRHWENIARLQRGAERRLGERA